ncbi:MAG: hypothetical protein RLY35_292 [Bacteroidota bacterium]|jgi:hypothetical protein
MKKLLLILAMLPSLIWAQRNCGSNDHHVYMMGADPNYVQRQQQIEEQTQEFVAHYGENSNRALVTIPVVFHIVYNGTTNNISDAQVLSQLQVLNQDFRKLNQDVGLTPSLFTASDPNIEFCLATVDPNGNATTGITRTSTTVSSWSTNDYVKYSVRGGKDAWDATKYLNIWVCTLSGGILGYAQFPGGAAATDGVVIDYRYLGTTGTATAPFNKGRTATHEVGHWLNLRHIWGDANCGSDLVNDTPTHNTSNFGCPTYPHYSTCTGAPVEMTMNYMDYTDDACMYMFSAGQSARMQALFASGGARASLLTSNGCSTPTPILCGVPTLGTTSGITQTGATLNWSAVTGATSYNVQYKVSTAATWITTTTSSLSLSLTGLIAGTTYNFQVSATCSAGIGNYSAMGSFATTAVAATCTDNYESNNTLSTSKTIAKNTDITARIATSTDKDYFNFVTTTADKNIRIDLFNLPADYDVKLYRNNTLVSTSANTGLTSESIIYNNGATGTYRVYVYGFNGAFNANACYTLRASTSSIAFREMQEGATAETVFTESAALSIANAFPNPTQGNVNISFHSLEEGVVNVALFDLTGRKIIEQKWMAFSGLNTVEFGLQDIASGNYVLVLMNENGTDTRIIQKD